MLKFRTFEPDHPGTDLDHCDNTELILQRFDFCVGRVTVIGAVGSPPGQAPLGTHDDNEVFHLPAGRYELRDTCDPTGDQCEAGTTRQDDRWVLAQNTCAPHTSGKVKIVMEGKRDLLQMPDLAVLALLPVTGQLGNRGDDTC